MTTDVLMAELMALGESPETPQPAAREDVLRSDFPGAAEDALGCLRDHALKRRSGPGGEPNALGRFLLPNET